MENMFWTLAFSVMLFPLTRGENLDHSLKRCCDFGLTKASEEYNCNVEPLTDIPAQHQSVCLSTMELCCARKIRELDCDEGKLTAKSGGSCPDKITLDEQHCCEACKMGQSMGSSGSPCNLGSTSFGKLWDSAFYSCCGEAKFSADQRLRNEKQEPEEPLKTKNETSAGMCEMLEGELCAHICVSLPGSYKCQCKTGYLLMADGKSCEQRSTPRPQHSAIKASETAAAHRCLKGFRFNPSLGGCQDVNECEEDNPCDSTQNCRNTVGSYHCDCKVGFQLDELTHACVDVNECQTNKIACQDGERCDNTFGSYNCIRFLNCGTGYTLNAATGRCEDDDECAMGTDNCSYNGADWECKNIQGSFRCIKRTPTSSCGGTTCKSYISCPSGYAYAGHNKCIDINECNQGIKCKSDEKCVNTPGSFTCVSAGECKPGFKFNEAKTHCVDIDECDEQEDLCSHKCINTFGSFTCGCSPGYKLDEDNRTCVDENECEVADRYFRPCNGFCVNQPGSFSCECPTGYTLAPNKVSCQDIDECASNPCSPNEVCTNLRGSFKCTEISCMTGYTRDEKKQNRCMRQTRCSETDEACKAQPLSYTAHFYSMTSNYSFPISGLTFFTMRGPLYSSTTVNFEFDIIDAAAPNGIRKATKRDFKLSSTGYNQATLSLMSSLQGPQEVEILLKMTFYNNRLYGGFTQAKIYLFVSEFDF